MMYLVNAVTVCTKLSSPSNISPRLIYFTLSDTAFDQLRDERGQQHKHTEEARCRCERRGCVCACCMCFGRCCCYAADHTCPCGNSSGSSSTWRLTGMNKVPSFVTGRPFSNLPVQIRPFGYLIVPFPV